MITTVLHLRQCTVYYSQCTVYYTQ